VLHISGWSKWLTLIVVAVGMLVALPNALPPNVRERLPSWLPRQAVNLGLDLQGGSHLLLEVDLPQVQKERAEGLMGDIGAALRKARIATSGLEARGDTVQVTIADAGRYAEARTLVQNLNPTMATSLTGGTRQYDLTEPGGNRLVLRQTQAFADLTRQQILEQSVEVVRRRIDELGTREPSITVQQPDRIVVEVPGLSDPAHLKEILGRTAKMTFHLVDETADANHATRAPIGDDLLPQQPLRDGTKPPPLAVQHRIAVSGDRLTDAGTGFDQRNGQPVVTFRFDNIGARQFGDITKNNRGRRFAIVLDDVVISAPRIDEPILGGSGQIYGSFTTQTANDLAVLMRSGALPAKLNVIAESTVGAELGADSISAGRISAIAGLALVALFMVLRYGLFGLFADLALTLNLILLLAALTPLATLTLPGIAGIVLTLGMAVDANVLIFERIREEQRNGRGMLASIDTGFRRAMATIIDANATHIIAAMILFELGAGPVKGFAVALFLGIITSFFTSVVVTRLIVVTWLNVARPRALVI
jgi:protein-export membrane protein SecD